MKQLQKAVLVLDLSTFNATKTSVRFSKVSYGYVTPLFFFGKLVLYRDGKSELAFIQASLRKCTRLRKNPQPEGYDFAQDYSWDNSTYFSTTPEQLIFLDKKTAQEVEENINGL